LVKRLGVLLKSGFELHTKNKLRSLALPRASRDLSAGIGLSVAERFGSTARLIMAGRSLIKRARRLVQMSIDSVWVCLSLMISDGKWLSFKVGFTYLQFLRHCVRLAVAHADEELLSVHINCQKAQLPVSALRALYHRHRRDF